MGTGPKPALKGRAEVRRPHFESPDHPGFEIAVGGQTRAAGDVGQDEGAVAFPASRPQAFANPVAQGLDRRQVRQGCVSLMSPISHPCPPEREAKPIAHLCDRSPDGITTHR